jgi:hypothetical protein
VAFKTDFYITGNTIVWMVFCLLLIACLVCYRVGYRNGFTDERRGWIEDVITGQNTPIVKPEGAENVER